MSPAPRVEDPLVDGREAERLLADPTLQKALQQIENDAAESWKVATTKEKREELHATVRAIMGLRNKLDAMKANKVMIEAQEKLFAKRQPR